MFVKLSHCLEQRGSCKATGAVVVGGPGSGKTALCCEIVWPGSGQSARPQRCLNKRLLAYHFCQAHDIKTLSVTDFIIGLANQLSEKLATISEGFSERLKSDPEVVSALQRENIVKSPDDSFRKGIIVPLAEIKPPPSQCYFVLVDSIDETHISGVKFDKKNSLGRSRTIGELLANNHHIFPPWILLVVTARRQSKTIAKFFSGFRKISLDDLRKSQVRLKSSFYKYSNTYKSDYILFDKMSCKFQHLAFFIFYANCYITCIKDSNLNCYDR